MPIPCTTHEDPDLWFPVGHSGPALMQIEAAKSWCSICPIKMECLANALARGDDNGIWGGTTPWERRQLLRKNPNLGRGMANGEHASLRAVLASPVG